MTADREEQAMTLAEAIADAMGVDELTAASLAENALDPFEGLDVPFTDGSNL